MKKYFVAIALLATIIACGTNNEKKEEKTIATPGTPATVSTDHSSNPDYQRGLELVAKSDCLTCHKISDKLTGPAYKDVAAKYESTDDNIAMLAGKIIKGGSGNWGAIPMTPHAALSEDDAKQMVKYILLLKK